jgi:DNA polymerase-3 subunit alpha
MPDFVGLHRHSMYSLLDGMGSPEQIVTRLKAIGQTACAMTDHGSVFGHIHFGTTMLKAGLKPLYGIEFYHCNDMTQKGTVSSSKKDQATRDNKQAHLTVLAYNQRGYKNLLRMYYLSYAEGFYSKPRVDWDCVIRHQEGLVVMTGCIGGLVSKLIQDGHADSAHKYCAYLKQQIEQFYVELVPCPGLEKTVNPHTNELSGVSSYDHCNTLYRIATDLDIPMVLTDDGHFPDPAHAEAQDTLFTIGQRRKMSDPKRYKIPDYHYYCTGEEMLARAATVMPLAVRAVLETACANTVKIANLCEVELPRSTGPVYNIASVPECKPGWTPYDLLLQWIEGGKQYRRGLGLLPALDTTEWREYEERLAYELEIIQYHSFENYFLVVTDIVRWCRQNRYWCIARGSAGGSLICWYLSITQIDPLFFKLPVERFIDKTRPDMPDIDLDIDARYHDAVFGYLEEKYGKSHTAQIAALSTFRPKQAIKDLCDVHEIPYSDGASLIGLLPEIDNEGGIKAKGLLAQLIHDSKAAQILIARQPKLALAAQLEGQVRNQTVHAAGVVVDCNDLSEIVGIVARPPDSRGKKFPRVVACDMNFAAQQGLLKIDLLSSETMAAVSELLEQHGHDHDWIYRLPFDEGLVYQILSEGRNTGLFQFKGQTTGRVMKDLKPSSIFDLVALAALGRPGPLQSGGTHEYIERKHGRMPMPDYHPAVMAVLGETYGVIIYQEQVMELMRVAGMDWPAVHKIRKLISKSGGTQALEQYHRPYLDGMSTRGINETEAEHLWVQCQKAGNYLFNKAHGAAYGLMAYWTAYLKTHFAAAFACVMVNHEKKDSQQRELLREFKASGGTLVLLDPNRSQMRFSSPAKNVILGGFQNLKGVGEAAARMLMNRQPYSDWTRFLETCPTALSKNLQAVGLHKDQVNLDIALAIAPWFVEIVYNEFEQEAFRRLKCLPVSRALELLQGGHGRFCFRMFGRITEIDAQPTRTRTGVGERALVTVTDPTGSVSIWYAAWRWEEIKRARDPLQGAAKGIGNSAVVTAVIANDGQRLFGEDLVVARACKGREVVVPREKKAAQHCFDVGAAAELRGPAPDREQLLALTQEQNEIIRQRRSGGLKRLQDQVLQFIDGLE